MLLLLLLLNNCANTKWPYCNCFCGLLIIADFWKSFIDRAKDSNGRVSVHILGCWVSVLMLFHSHLVFRVLHVCFYCVGWVLDVTCNVDSFCLMDWLLKNCNKCPVAQSCSLPPPLSVSLVLCECTCVSLVHPWSFFIQYLFPPSPPSLSLSLMGFIH